MDEFGYIKVHLGGLEILADGEDVTAVRHEVVHGLEHLFGCFTEAYHDAGFGRKSFGLRSGSMGGRY